MKRLAYKLFNKSEHPQPLLDKNKKKEAGTAKTSSPFFSKLYGKSGQHSLEYSMILILVMAGIILAGPYTIRAWNANLKGWEDSVIDSFDDPLLQAPNVISIPGCSCNLVPDVSCGTFGGCAKTEMCDQWRCSPPGCGMQPPWTLSNPPIIDNSCICTCNDVCCGDWVPTGNCGVNATHGPLPGGACPDGEMENSRPCGCSLTEWGCLPDPICQFNCTSPIYMDPLTMVLCPGWETGLPADMANILVGTCTLTTGHCDLRCCLATDPICPADFFPISPTTCGQCQDGTAVQGGCLDPVFPECEQIPPCPTGHCQGGGAFALPPPPPPPPPACMNFCSQSRAPCCSNSCPGGLFDWCLF